jgi:hypothetical protein
MLVQPPTDMIMYGFLAKSNIMFCSRTLQDIFSKSMNINSVVCLRLCCSCIHRSLFEIYLICKCSYTVDWKQWDIITNSTNTKQFSKDSLKVEEWKINLMSLAILLHFLCAQHVSDINISIIRSLQLCCWITTSVVLFSVRCVLDLWCGWF